MLAKVVLVLAVVGTLGYDAISMTTTHLSTQDHAQAAAVLGHEALRDSKSEKAAYAAIVKYAREHGDTVIPAGFKVGPHNSVTVQLRRQARTFVAGYIPTIESYATVTAVATASDPTS